MKRIRVIGGGLAGPEAALTAARRGCEVDLYELRVVVDGPHPVVPESAVASKASPVHAPPSAASSAT